MALLPLALLTALADRSAAAPTAPVPAPAPAGAPAPAPDKAVAPAAAVDPTQRPGSTAAGPAGTAVTSSALIFEGPAARFIEALPVGNGRLGAMVFGRVADDRMPLNENSLWDGYARDTTNADALTNLPTVRKLLFDGKHEEATKLAADRLMGKPLRIKPYQVLADLHIESPAPTTIRDYRRELDLATGIARISYRGDGQVVREVFASAPDQVIVLRLSSDKSGAVATRLRLSRWQDAKSLPAADGWIGLRGQIVRPDEASGDNRGLRFEACAKVLHDGGSMSGEGDWLRVSGANTITVIISGATSYRGGDPAKLCRGYVEKAAGKSYPQLRAAHVADHGALFGQATLDLRASAPAPKPAAEKDNEKDKAKGRADALVTTAQRLARHRAGVDDPTLVALQFQMGRYLLIGSSRPGQLPANLQGLWNEQLVPPWNADYHLNINLQMNYWPAELTGLSDLHGPMLDYIESLVPSGKRTAKVHYGARGFVAHHLSDIWGFTTPADGVQGVWPMGAAWSVRHFYDHYLFTADRDFLAKRAYPIMKEAALFMLDFLVPDPRGRLVTSPSHSPENAFKTSQGVVSKFTYGATMDLQIVHDLFTNTIAAAERLGVDSSLRMQLSAALRRLAPLEISSSTGRLREWIEDYAEVDPGHRHISHLFAVYPGNQITLRGTPALAAAARKSLEHRLSHGGGRTGWSRAWIANMWARFGDGDKAYENLKALLAENTSPSLLDLHPPEIFQIDGNSGAAAAVAEMLVQSHAGEVHLLPALPRAWPAGTVKGLRARGAYGVDIDWKEHAMQSARLSVVKTGPCRIRTAVEIDVMQAGKAVSVRRPEAGVVTFQAHQGTNYDLVPRKSGR
jgi:alpha-L-fucosidase 2